MLELLTLALPALVACAVGYLSHDRLAAWCNTVIAFVLIVATALLWALFARSLTGNALADSLILAGYISVLMYGPLKPLFAFATLSWPSPLRALVAKLPDAFRADQGVVATVVPVPRASLLSKGQLWAVRAPGEATSAQSDIADATTAEMPSVPPMPPPQTPSS